MFFMDIIKDYMQALKEWFSVAVYIYQAICLMYDNIRYQKDS